MAVQIQWRRATAAVWTAANTVLGDGEGGWETDTLKLKIGNGVTAWNSLAYFGGAPSGAAGGSLAGTYPSPTFAGRDSSVDKINQDMLPGWLDGGRGIATIPAATGVTLGVTVVDLGSTVAVNAKTFTVADANAAVGKRVMASIGNDATTQHMSDDLEFDTPTVTAKVLSAGNLSIVLTADPSSGPIYGSYSVNYIIG